MKNSRGDKSAKKEEGDEKEEAQKWGGKGGLSSLNMPMGCMKHFFFGRGDSPYGKHQMTFVFQFTPFWIIIHQNVKLGKEIGFREGVVEGEKEKVCGWRHVRLFTNVMEMLFDELYKSGV